MLISQPTLWEKSASTLKRAFTRSGDYLPQEPENTDILTQLYISRMFKEGNFFHRHIINRTAPHIHLDETHLETIKLKATQGPLIYMTVDVGQLEYNVFNHICVERELPLAQFNNALRTRRWLKFSEIRRSYKQRIRFLTTAPQLPHPLASGYLQKILLEKKSILLSLDDSDPTYLSTPNRDLFTLLLKTQAAAKIPVFIVPLQLVWDKRPRREKASLFESVFGENEKPGWFKKMILFIRHYKNRAVVKLGEPISLQLLLEKREEDPLHLYQKVLGSLQIEKRSLTGPPIRPRSWFLERIFEDADLSKTLYEVSKEKNKPFTSVQRLAWRYAKEIAANVSYSRIEWGMILIDWYFRHLFDRLYIDPDGLKRLKKALSQGPTVLVPNHRSHLDYLLLGYLCYQNNIVLPYVAAGINLAFWPLGSYFRRCGAFFLRRSFAGNQLYKKVFQTYLKILLREGYPQEFFIEGGRSRTGKLRSPKLGMLSMYSEAMHEGAAKDIQFVPVSITYDRVLEQKSYAEEMEGKPKPQEKTRDLLKLRKFLKGRYGNIYVNFDEPISWQATATEISETPWEKKKPKVVELLSRRICHAINRQMVVVPQALAATALLASPKKGFEVETVRKFYLELLNYLKWKQVKLSSSLQHQPEAAFTEAIHQFEMAGLIKMHQGLDQTFFEIPPEKRLEIDFFKNTSIHYFVSLALWSNHLLTRKGHRFESQQLADGYAYFQQLFHYEFRFSTRLPLNQHLDKLCCYLQEKKLIEYNGTTIEILKEGKETLQKFSRLTRHFVEGYWVAWKTYLLRPIYPNDEKALLKAMLSHGKHQWMLGSIQYPEAISQSIFENAIQAFQGLNLFAQESHLTKKMEEALEKLLNA